MENQIQLGHLQRIREKVNQTDVYYVKEIITPIKAKELLELNTNNRPLKQDAIKQYAADMQSNKWESDTGETIKISKLGKLIDGQNRLHAVIKSNVSVMMHIAYNVPDRVFQVLDTHSKRSGGDVLAIYGVKNSSKISGIIRTYLNLVEEYKNLTRGNTGITNRDVLEQYKAMPDFWDNVYKYSKDWKKSFSKVIKDSWIGGVYAYLHFYNADKAFDFFNQLCMEEKTENKNIRLLRKRFLDDAVSGQKNIKPMIRLALIIKTWNYFVTNQTVKVLKINPNEEFPRPLIGDLI